MGAPTKPVPAGDPALEPFLAAAREHQLVVQRCDGCGALRFPPRELCSACLATGSAWVRVSGRGTVFSFNVMHQVYHPAFATEVPYVVAVVQLEEGPRLVTNVVDCPPAEMRIGLPVDVVFEAVTPEVTLPKFRRRPGA